MAAIGGDCCALIAHITTQNDAIHAIALHGYTLGYEKAKAEFRNWLNDVTGATVAEKHAHIHRTAEQNSHRGKIIAFERPDDGARFTLNKDGTTYSLEFETNRRNKSFKERGCLGYSAAKMFESNFIPIYEKKVSKKHVPAK